MTTQLTQDFHKAFNKIKSFSDARKNPPNEVYGMILIKPVDTEHVTLESSTGIAFARFTIPLTNDLEEMGAGSGLLLPRMIKGRTQITGRTLQSPSEEGEILRHAEKVWPDFDNVMTHRKYGYGFHCEDLDSCSLKTMTRKLGKVGSKTTVEWTPEGLGSEACPGKVLATTHLIAKYLKAASRVFGSDCTLYVHSTDWISPFIMESDTALVCIMPNRHPVK